MPSIVIREQDQSAVNYTSSASVVYVPIEGAKPNYADKNGCYLFESTTDSHFEDASKYVKTLLRAELSVLCHYLGETKKINELTETDLAFLKDKDLYDVKFLTSGDYVMLKGIYPDVSSYYIRVEDSESLTYIPASGVANPDTLYYQLSGTDTPKVVEVGVTDVSNYFILDGNSYVQASGTAVAGTDYYDISATSTTFSAEVNTTLLNIFNQLAADRGDCATIAALDVHNFESLANIKTLLGNVSTITNGERCGIFAADMSDERVIAGTSQYRPDLAYLVNYGASLLNGTQWEAIAGVNRGKVKDFNKLACVSKYELDTSVETREGVSFNGLVQLRPSGETIWGDRTAFKNTTDLIASSFLSIRNIISDLAKTIYNQAVTYTFETNNEITWANFKNTIANLLDQMVQAQVLANYSIIKLKSDQRAQIKCEVHIAPYGPVEDFDITIVLTSEGLDINIA